MNILNHKAISRRTMLRGAGACVALPLLEAMLPSRVFGSESTYRPWPKSPMKPTPRVIFCYVPNGVNILEWVPPAAGKGNNLSPTLDALKEHRNHFSVISGLGHPRATGGHSGADTWLTGADLRAVPGKDYTNTISADQVIAEKIGLQTRLPSLEIGDMSGTGGASLMASAITSA